MNVSWGRLLTAVITPYDKYGNVDYTAAADLSEYLIQNGSDGVVVAGTTGESPVLTETEKQRLCLSIKERLGDSGIVIAATGTNNTAKTVEATRWAHDNGLDGARVVVPYYNKPSQQGLYEHFQATAEASQLPIMIYNIPSRTGATLSVDTTARLAELPNVVALKAATGNVMEISHLRQTAARQLLLYSGDDPLTLPLLTLGAHRVVSVASHLAARQLRKMLDAFASHDVDAALAIHERLLPLFEALFVDVNPVPVKTMLDMVGRPTGGFRLPLVPPDALTREHIFAVLNRHTTLLDYHLPDGQQI